MLDRVLKIVRGCILFLLANSLLSHQSFMLFLLDLALSLDIKTSIKNSLFTRALLNGQWALDIEYSHWSITKLFEEVCPQHITVFSLLW